MFFVDRLDEVNDILDEIYEEIPKYVLEGLNGGIIISEEIKYHPESVDNELLILGQYERTILGQRVVIFYGSIMEIFWDLPREELKEKLRGVLFHELTHHMEFRAHNNDLEIEDKNFIDKYKRDKGLDE